MAQSLWKYYSAATTGVQLGQTPHRGRLYSVDITSGDEDTTVTIYDAAAATDGRQMFYGASDQSLTTATIHHSYTPGRLYSTGLYVVITGAGTPKIVIGYD